MKSSVIWKGKQSSFQAAIVVVHLALSAGNTQISLTITVICIIQSASEKQTQFKKKINELKNEEGKKGNRRAYTPIPLERNYSGTSVILDTE